MKEKLILATTANSIYVTDTAELKEALSQAKPGDDIVLAPGKYVYEGSTPKGRLFVGEADGTEDKPITLRSENPNDPAVLSGIEVSKNYVLTILGDHWIVRDIVAENAGKGIIVDNSCYTKIINCEVRNIGQEGIHLRDDSSYCIVESCYVHDTGLTHPSYGEAEVQNPLQVTVSTAITTLYATAVLDRMLQLNTLMSRSTQQAQ